VFSRSNACLLLLLQLLSTEKRWGVSIPNKSSSVPRFGHLLLSRTLSPASSSENGSSTTNWQSSTFVAAAVNSSVQFLKWTAWADISSTFAEILPLELQTTGYTAEPYCERWCSDSHQEATPTSSMVELPTNSPSPG
jgi:hypothetical protein